MEGPLRRQALRGLELTQLLLHRFCRAPPLLRSHAQLGVLTHEPLHLPALLREEALLLGVTTAERLGLGAVRLRRGGRGVALL